MNSGFVRIAGPFHLTTMQYVYCSGCGVTCQADTECCGDDSHPGIRVDSPCDTCFVSAETRNLMAATKGTDRLPSLKASLQDRRRAKVLFARKLTTTMMIVTSIVLD